MKSIGLGVRTYRWQRVLVMEVLSKKFSGIPRAGDGKKSLTYLLNIGLRTKSPRGPTTALAFIMFASLLGDQNLL